MFGFYCDFHTKDAYKITDVQNSFAVTVDSNDIRLAAIEVLLRK